MIGTNSAHWPDTRPATPPPQRIALLPGLDQLRVRRPHRNSYHYDIVDALGYRVLAALGLKAPK